MARSDARNPRKIGLLLWAVQVLLAALFLFAGGMKLIMPAAALTQGTPLSAGFLRFIGIAETLGALGLVLPGLLRIHTELTPLAAVGLAIIMVGATVTTLALGQGAGALVPLVVGVLAVAVAYGRARHPARRLAVR